MLVSEIVDQILFRVGRKLISDYGEPFLLSTMNRLYHEVNEDLRALEKTTTFDFSTVPDPSATPYMSLPADWLYPFRMSPYKIFRQPTVFSESEPNTCTFYDNKFWIAGATSQDLFDVGYYGLGRELVNETNAVYNAHSAEDKLIYINVPEWSPSHLHSFLIFATALELSENYPLRKTDEMRYSKLYEQLDRRNWLRTLAHPIEEGPDVRQTVITDPYA